MLTQTDKIYAIYYKKYSEITQHYVSLIIATCVLLGGTRKTNQNGLG